MGGSNLQDALLVLLGAAAFLHLAGRRPRTDVHGALLALLGFLVVYALGRLALETATDAPGARLGLLVSQLGALGMTPSALWFAARFTRSRQMPARPELLLALSIPSVLALFALATNDGHRLFAESLDPELLRQGASSWGGPVFWMSLAWQVALALIALGLLVQHLLQQPPSPRRRALVALVCSWSLPVASAVAHHLDWLPFEANPTPLCAGAAVAIGALIAVRARLTDVLPLARRDVIEALSDAVILADVSGRVLDLNPAAVRLLAAEPGMPWGGPGLARTLARLADDSAMDEIERSLGGALSGGAPVDLSLCTRDGRNLEIHLDGVHGHEREPSGWFVWIRDVTEAHRYERMRRESQQRVIVGGLAAGIAHEVNNPLAFVASNLQQIHRIASFEPTELEPFEKHRAEELAELPEVVVETIEGVARIADIVARIIRPGTLSEEDLIRLDLGRVIEDAVRLLELHGQYSVPTRVESMGQLPGVEGSPERLSQALLNLLLNAQQACQSVRGATLSIGARPDPAGVSVHIGLRCGDAAWEGPMPEIAPGAPGAEAELSAAYEIVREHGGQLEGGDAAGELFVMRLPAA